jgi:DNA-binding winged helix-turn-helix (wHTH) protein
MPKDFAVLHYLVAHPEQLVTHEELLKAVWLETVVNPGVLKVCLRRIRRALNDPATAPRFIETVHRRGYRFIAPLTATLPVSSSQFPVSGSEDVEELKAIFGQTVAALNSYDLDAVIAPAHEQAVSFVVSSTKTEGKWLVVAIHQPGLPSADSRDRSQRTGGEIWKQDTHVSPQTAAMMCAASRLFDNKPKILQ